MPSHSTIFTSSLRFRRHQYYGCIKCSFDIIFFLRTLAIYWLFLNYFYFTNQRVVISVVFETQEDFWDSLILVVIINYFIAAPYSCYTIAFHYFIMLSLALFKILKWQRLDTQFSSSILLTAFSTLLVLYIIAVNYPLDL